MDFTYKIVRSAKRRKLTISIERDRSVIVHAPLNTSVEKIQEVLQSKQHWIHQKISHSQKYQDLPHPPGKEMVSGESALYLGRQYRIEIIKNGLEEIQFDNRFSVPASLGDKGSEAFRAWYINRANEKIVPRVKIHSRELGVDIAKIKIINSRFRWGSCTLKNNVNFNWRLIKAPMFVIDYVIVHELTHLLEANHTPRFWNIVKSKIAQVDQAKQWLKQNGQLLEQKL